MMRLREYVACIGIQEMYRYIAANLKGKRFKRHMRR